MSKEEKGFVTLIRKDHSRVRIDKLIKNGRVEVTREEFEEWPLGSLVSYTNKRGMLKQGGFITGFEENCFLFIAPDFSTQYRAKYDKIDKILVGNVYQVKNDIVSITESDRPVTIFTVTIDGINIYYGRNQPDADRYKYTIKYIACAAWYEKFGNK